MFKERLPGVVMLGLFDGHGGPWVAEYAAEHIVDCVLGALPDRGDIAARVDPDPDPDRPTAAADRDDIAARMDPDPDHPTAADRDEAKVLSSALYTACLNVDRKVRA